MKTALIEVQDMINNYYKEFNKLPISIKVNSSTWYSLLEELKGHTRYSHKDQVGYPSYGIQKLIVQDVEIYSKEENL